MESKFQRKLREFFAYRNGLDEIGIVCFIVSFIFSILNVIFPKIIVFYILSIVLIFYVIFRIMSRNINQRQKENYAFTRFFSNIFKRGSKDRPIKQKPIKVNESKVKKEKKKKEEIIKDKNYVYKNCPHCNNTLKISKKIKGERIIMCTKCYNETHFKI